MSLDTTDFGRLGVNWTVHMLVFFWWSRSAVVVWCYTTLLSYYVTKATYYKYTQSFYLSRRTCTRTWTSIVHYSSVLGNGARGRVFPRHREEALVHLLLHLQMGETTNL